MECRKQPWWWVTPRAEFSVTFSGEAMRAFLTVVNQQWRARFRAVGSPCSTMDLREFGSGGGISLRSCSWYMKAARP